MQKVFKTITENRIKVFLFWIVLVYLIGLFFIKGVFDMKITIIQILFIFVIGCFTYIDISLSIEYFNTQKILTFLEKIREQFEYLEIYTESNNIIVEILKIEKEKFEDYVVRNGFHNTELLQKEQMIQYIVKG